jgi:hypothetical protein
MHQIVGQRQLPRARIQNGQGKQPPVVMPLFQFPLLNM